VPWKPRLHHKIRIKRQFFSSEVTFKTTLPENKAPSTFCGRVLGVVTVVRDGIAYERQGTSPSDDVVNDAANQARHTELILLSQTVSESEQNGAGLELKKRFSPSGPRKDCHDQNQQSIYLQFSEIGWKFSFAPKQLSVRVFNYFLQCFRAGLQTTPRDAISTDRKDILLITKK